MLNETDQRELLNFSATEPVVSVYLNTDPASGNADAYRLRLRSMLKEVNLPQDVEAIERYFHHEYNWSGKGVAVFSCAPKAFFRVYSLGVPVRDMLHIGERPSVKPLADLLDTYGGYGVVLVDKQGARVFSFHLGQLREQEGVVGETVKHIKHGGASSRPGARGGVAGQTHYEDELVERNMKEAVDFAVRFFEDNHVRRVLIGGTDENVASFRGRLPKAWQSLVMGTFAMPMTATHADVLGKALQLGVQAQQEHEARLVDRLMTAAAKAESGVTGMEATLASIQDGRVQTLLVLEGFRAPAYRCKNCGRLTAARGAACQSCGGEMEGLYDGVEEAVNTVMRGGGDVQVIFASQALQDAGSIGALLRY
jgi:peptide subunit release factor 1 (eRF1)